MNSLLDEQTIMAMRRYGGSFVQALAVCAALADHENLARIKSTWPVEWEQYRKMAITKALEEAAQ